MATSNCIQLHPTTYSSPLTRSRSKAPLPATLRVTATSATPQSRRASSPRRGVPTGGRREFSTRLQRVRSRRIPADGWGGKQRVTIGRELSTGGELMARQEEVQRGAGQAGRGRVGRDNTGYITAAWPPPWCAPFPFARPRQRHRRRCCCCRWANQASVAPQPWRG